MKPAEVVDGKEIAAVTLNYGNFLQATFDFLIIAFSIFMFIKLITKLTEKKRQKNLPHRRHHLHPLRKKCCSPRFVTF